MEEIMSNISLPVSFGAALASLVVGAIWYSPMLFGNAWMKSIGKTEKDLEGGNMAVIFGLTYLLSVVMAHFIQMVIEIMHWHPQDPSVDFDMTQSFHTFPHGALHGGMLALVFVAPAIIIINLFARRPFVNSLIHIGYWVVVMAIMGGIGDAF